MTGRGAASQHGYFMDVLPIYLNVEDFGGQIGLSPPASCLYKPWDRSAFSNTCLTKAHAPRVEPRPSRSTAIALEQMYDVGVYRQACSGIPLAVGFVGRDQRLWNSMVQGTQRFRQVRVASCVIPYVMCGDLYCLRC